MIQKAVATPGLKVMFGTDAVAGAHGRNADEIVERVQAGRSVADRRHHLGDVDGGAVAATGDDRSVRSRPATRPTSSRLNGDPTADITAVRG